MSDLLLTAENYKHGFLVDDEAIAGVTELAGDAVFAAYVSHYLTGETLSYQEFETAEAALAYLASIKRPWRYEAVGCSSKTSGGKSSGGCGSGKCGGGSCGSN